jgi:antitoxin component YwqK of YwqJK toxin-antitoxin module
MSVVVERDSFTKKREYCVDKNGNKQGQSLEWDSDGGKREYYYINGKENGREKAWWPNGQIKMEGTWNSSLLLKNTLIRDGIFRNWHQNGQLESEAVYKDNGIVWWNPEVKDKPSGSMCWDEKGKIVYCPLARRPEIWPGQKRYKIKEK